MCMFRMIRFYVRRRRAGLPVKFGTRPCNVTTYSSMTLLRESDCVKRSPRSSSSV